MLLNATRIVANILAPATTHCNGLFLHAKSSRQLSEYFYNAQGVGLGRFTLHSSSEPSSYDATELAMNEIHFHSSSCRPRSVVRERQDQPLFHAPNSRMKFFAKAKAAPLKSIFIYNQEKNTDLKTNILFLVPRRGLEPPRDCSHIHLKDARIPVPPPGQASIALILYE